MFEMTVINAMVVNSKIVTVAGPCVNRIKFTSRLLDEHGNEYVASIPLDATVLFDDSQIILELKGDMTAESLIGKTLRSA